MSDLKRAFKNGKAFISFLTAGDPSVDKTGEFILKLQEAGSDLIEIGIPFSDPIAEGEVIERANLRALDAGATTDKIFEMVKSLRGRVNIPLVFLTYMNPVIAYGTDRFFKNCNECGVDGIIIPDLPFEEKGEILEVAAKYAVELVTLIAPTSCERIRMLAKDAKGFIYVVSSMGVTGVRAEIKTDLSSIISDIREVTDVPVAVGFGISTESQAAEISKISDGVIVGSAIVKIIEQYGDDAAKYLFDYVSGMKNAVRGN